MLKIRQKGSRWIRRAWRRNVRTPVMDWLSGKAYRYIVWYCRQHLKIGLCKGCEFKNNGHCLIKLRSKYTPEHCRYASETDLYDGWECALTGGACLHWKHKKKDCIMKG